MKTPGYVVLVTENEVELVHSNSRYVAEMLARSWKRQHPDDKVQLAIHRNFLGIKITTDFKEVTL